MNWERIFWHNSQEEINRNKMQIVLRDRMPRFHKSSEVSLLKISIQKVDCWFCTSSFDIRPLIAPSKNKIYVGSRKGIMWDGERLGISWLTKDWNNGNYPRWKSIAHIASVWSTKNRDWLSTRKVPKPQEKSQDSKIRYVITRLWNTDNCKW